MAGTATITISTKLTGLGSEQSRTNTFIVSGVTYKMEERGTLSTAQSAIFEMTPGSGRGGFTSCKYILIQNVSANNDTTLFAGTSKIGAVASGNAEFRILPGNQLAFGPISADMSTLTLFNSTSGTILYEFVAYGT